MKKLLLLLLCFPFIGFGQYQYKLDSITLNFPISLNLQETTVYKFEYNSQSNNITVEMPNYGDSTLHITDSNGTIIYSYDKRLIFLSYNLNNKLMTAQTAFLETVSQNIEVVYQRTYSYNSNSNLESVESERTTLGNSIFNNASNFIIGSGFGGKSKITRTYVNSQNILDEYWDWDGSIYVQTNKTEITMLSGVPNSSIHYINPANWEINSIINYNWSAGDILSETSIQYQSNGSNDTSTTNYYYNNALTSNTAPNFGTKLISGIDIYTYHQIDSIVLPDLGSSLSFFYSAFTSTDIREQSTNKELLKITDLIGRETKGKKNEPLLYLYDDGTVEKRIVIE